LKTALQRLTALVSLPLLLAGNIASAAQQIIELGGNGAPANVQLPRGTREVDLVTQRAGNCRFGRTWGYDLTTLELWVNGCAGSFRLTVADPQPGAAPAAGAPDSSNAAAALAAAAAIAGIAILASRGNQDHNHHAAYPPQGGQYYPPPNGGYSPPPQGASPPGGGRQGAIRGPNNLCLDMRGGAAVQGTELNVFRCHGGPNQSFTWTPRGELMVQGLCLDIANADRNDGAKVVTWRCNGGPNQRWAANGAQIQSQMNSKCLDIFGGNLNSGTPVIMYSCSGRANQRWYW
jgi:hypothetical protein